MSTITISVTDLNAIIQKALKKAEEEIKKQVMQTNSSKKTKTSKESESSSETSLVPNPQSLSDINKLNKTSVMAYCDYHKIKVKSSNKGKNPLLPDYKKAAKEFWESHHSGKEKKEKKTEEEKSPPQSESSESSGHVTKSSVQKMVVEELRKLAKKNKIDLPKGAKKNDIRETLIRDLDLSSPSSSSSEKIESPQVKAEWNKELRIFSADIGGNEYLIDTKTNTIVTGIDTAEDGSPKISKLKVKMAKELAGGGYKLWNVVVKNREVNKTATAKEWKEIIEKMRASMPESSESSESGGADNAHSNSGDSSSSSSSESEPKQESSVSSSSSSEPLSNVDEDESSVEEGQIIDSELKKKIEVSKDDFEKFYKAIKVFKINQDDVNALVRNTGLSKEVVEEIKMRFKRLTEQYVDVVSSVILERRKLPETGRRGGRRPRFVR